MDKNNLVTLNGIAELVHEQNSARLGATKAELMKAKEQRRTLLRRPGDEISSSGDDVVAILAQTKWSNSVEAALPILDKKIQDLEDEVDKLVTQTRASFTKVTGIESLAKTQRNQDKLEAARREDQTQDMLISLRWSDHSVDD